MCPLPDFNGKDENAAGTDYGAIGMFRSQFNRGGNKLHSFFIIQGNPLPNRIRYIFKI